MGEQGTAGHLWLEFRPNPFSVFRDQVPPHVHHVSGLPKRKRITWWAFLLDHTWVHSVLEVVVQVERDL